jgi:hypothetical protein
MKDDLFGKRMGVAIGAKVAKVRARQHEEGTRFNIRRIDAGHLVLPTGRICVNDAYSADEYPPLNRIVPPGQYAVELVIAEIPKELPFGNARCAFAVVTFSDARVASWEPITAVKGAGPCFTDDRPNGIVQEGGTGLFSPESGQMHFSRLRKRFDDQLKLIRKKSQQFGCQDWINYRPARKQENIIIVEGGMGDGTYECFAGLSTIGRMSRLVVDFMIADAID